MEITRISAPKFFVDDEELNEYELRQLQYEVAKGEKPFGITVTDEVGDTFIIMSDGRFKKLSLSCFGTGGMPYNLDLTTRIIIEIWNLPISSACSP